MPSDIVPEPLAALPGLVAGGVLDAPLAALAWLLLERGVPVLVAGLDHAAAARNDIADALVGALPEGRQPGAAAGPHRVVRVAAPLEQGSPAGILGAALAATTGRSGLAATVTADDLEGVLAILTRQGLSTDEASFLGVVLVLRPVGHGPSPRVAIAHYLRPLVRDAGGHPRRLGPALLAAWDGGVGDWEDFSWGILPELAERSRLRAGDFDAERARRSALLGDLAARGAVGRADLEAAVAAMVPNEAVRDA
jgi:hypothetical protein